LAEHPAALVDAVPSARQDARSRALRPDERPEAVRRGASEVAALQERPVWPRPLVRLGAWPVAGRGELARRSRVLPAQEREAWLQRAAQP
jgi:hypothetical protein